MLEARRKEGKEIMQEWFLSQGPRMPNVFRAGQWLQLPLPRTDGQDPSQENFMPRAFGEVDSKLDFPDVNPLGKMWGDRARLVGR